MQHLNIILFGDWGFYNEITKKNIAMMEAINADFYILLGDNFYPNGVKSTKDPQWLYKYKNIFRDNDKTKFAILGNHDYITNPQAQIEFTKIDPNWQMPFYYYDMLIYLPTSQVHFIFVDSNLLADDITIPLLKNTDTSDASYRNYLNLRRTYEEKQRAWLEEVLQKSPAKWKIVCGHYPIYSVGPHTISQKYQRYMTSLFEKYGVDIYFSGHDHNMQHILYKNTNYIISGAFSSFYKKHRGPHNYFMQINYVSDDGGFVNLHVSDDAIEIQFLESLRGVAHRHLCRKL